MPLHHLKSCLFLKHWQYKLNPKDKENHSHTKFSFFMHILFHKNYHMDIQPLYNIWNIVIVFLKKSTEQSLAYNSSKNSPKCVSFSAFGFTGNINYKIRQDNTRLHHNVSKTSSMVSVIFYMLVKPD